MSTEKLINREKLNDLNAVLIVFDSCRFDSAQLANMPNLNKVGQLMDAQTLSPYTPAAHTAMFLGHLPSNPKTKVPFYNETVRQPWRITTGPSRDSHKGCGMLFEGNNVIEGFRREGHHVLGIGGVSQFSDGSFLRTAYAWSEFIYFGPNMDDEPLAERQSNSFPLNHTEQILDKLKTAAQKGPFTLFMNCPETHYPYDWGKGISEEVKAVFPTLKKGLNLRTHSLLPQEREILAQQATNMHQMQVNGLEFADQQLGILFEGIRSITDQATYVFACADHGEHFGEKGRYGHMQNTKECLTVPLWMGLL